MAEADPSAPDTLREAALAEIAASPDLAALDQVRVRYLGQERPSDRPAQAARGPAQGRPPGRRGPH